MHEWRKQWAHDVLFEEFVWAVEYLSQVPRAKTVSTRHGSYTLKHRAEVWANHYICNGALICAALFLGFKIRRIENCPNVYLNVGNAKLWPQFTIKGDSMRERFPFG